MSAAGAAPPLATIAPLAPPQNNVAAAAGVRARSALRADVPRTRSLSDIFSPEPAGRKSLQAKSAELFLREPEKRPRPRLGSWAQALPAARAQTAKKDPSDRGGAEQDRDAAKSDGSLTLDLGVRKITRQMRHDQALADFQVSVDRVTGAVKLEKDAVLDEYEQLTVADNKDRAALIMEITNPYHISRLNKSDMLNYWPAVRKHSQKRMSSIDILETRLEALEEHRAQLLQREVRELQVKLKDIGWVSQNALTGIIQDQTHVLNTTILSNKMHIVEWCADLRAENVRQERQLRHDFNLNFETIWKKRRAEHLSETYKQSVRSTKFPERREALSAIRDEISEVHASLSDHITTFFSQSLMPTPSSLGSWMQRADTLIRQIEPHLEGFMRTVRAHNKAYIAAMLDSLTRAYRAGLLECDVKPANIQVEVDSILKQMSDEAGYAVGEGDTALVEGLPVNSLTRYVKFEVEVVENFGQYMYAISELWHEHQADISKCRTFIQQRFQEAEKLYKEEINRLQTSLDGVLSEMLQESDESLPVESHLETVKSLLRDMEKAHRDHYDTGVAITNSIPEMMKKRIDAYRERFFDFFEVSLSPKDISHVHPLAIARLTPPSPGQLMKPSQSVVDIVQKPGSRPASAGSQPTVPVSADNPPRPPIEITPTSTMSSAVTGTTFYLWERMDEAELLRETTKRWKQRKAIEEEKAMHSVAFQPEGLKPAKGQDGSSMLQKERRAKVRQALQSDQKPEVPKPAVAGASEQLPLSEYEFIGRSINLPSLPLKLMTSLRKKMQKAYLEQLEKWEQATLEKANNTVELTVDQMVNTLNKNLYEHSKKERTALQDTFQHKAVQLMERQQETAREISQLRALSESMKANFAASVRGVDESTSSFVQLSKKYLQNLRKTRTVEGTVKVRADFAACYERYLQDANAAIAQASAAFDDKYLELKVRRHNANAGHVPDLNMDGYVSSFAQKLDSYKKKAEQAMAAISEAVELRSEDLKFLDITSRLWGVADITVKAEMTRSNNAAANLTQDVEKFSSHIVYPHVDTDEERLSRVLQECERARLSIHARGMYLSCFTGAPPSTPSPDTGPSPNVLQVSFDAWKESQKSLHYAKSSRRQRAKSSAEHAKRAASATSALKSGARESADMNSENFREISQRALDVALQSVLQAGEDFFRKKGIRPIHCSERVPPNLPAFTASATEHAGQLRAKYEGYRKQQVANFREQLARLWNASGALCENMVGAIAAHAQRQCRSVMLEEGRVLDEELTQIKLEKIRHWHNLRPSIAHRDNADKLEKLDTVANLSSNKAMAVMDNFKSTTMSKLGEIMEQFVEELCFFTVTLVKILNATPAVESVEKEQGKEEYGRISIRELLADPEAASAERRNKPSASSAGRKYVEYGALKLSRLPFDGLRLLEVPVGSFKAPSTDTYKTIHLLRDSLFEAYAAAMTRHLDWTHKILDQLRKEEQQWLSGWIRSVNKLKALQL